VLSDPAITGGNDRLGVVMVAEINDHAASEAAIK
jgi:hypothetical protein